MITAIQDMIAAMNRNTEAVSRPVILPAVENPAALPVPQTEPLPGKPKRESATAQRVRQWLIDNPDKATLSAREIAGLIGGVSHTTVAQVKRGL